MFPVIFSIRLPTEPITWLGPLSKENSWALPIGLFIFRKRVLYNLYYDNKDYFWGCAFDHSNFYQNVHITYTQILLQYIVYLLVLHTYTM